MPGLLTLKTDLKSLKYGQDRAAGGSSGQPYIKTSIDQIDSVINQIRTRVGDDGLIRGGALGSTYAATIDTLRIGKFFSDIPRGPLFIAKQVGLQLSNPKLEINKNNKTIGGLLSTITNGLLGPTRIYNLGVNTLAQIPVNAVGGHIVRHGVLPISDPKEYYASVVYNNNQNGSNRLVKLTKSFKLGDRELNKYINLNSRISSGVNNLTDFLRLLGVNLPSLNLNQNFINNTIDEYLGGPGSVYGVGKTLIKRYSYSENLENHNNSLLWSKSYAGKTRDENGESGIAIDLNKVIGVGDYSISNYPNIPNIPLPENIYGNIKTYSNISKVNKNYKTIIATEYNTNERKSGLLTSHPVNQFNIISKDLNDKSIIVSGSIAYSSNIIPGEKIRYTNGYGDMVVVNMPNWAAASREKRVGSGRKDEINLTPIFYDNSGTHIDKVTIDGEGYKINDLVKFRIEAVDTDKPNKSNWMVFRAYITSLDDGVNANWDSIKYIGRGEEFYNYNGFTRKINITFKVAALSVEEMEPMYQKLNYLMSNLMPDYSNNLMRGPFTRMTVGNWIDGQPGIINSLSYNISKDSPWEVSLNEPTEGGSREMILPHIVDVSLSFTPIGAQTQTRNKNPRKSEFQSNIAQNYNGANENEPNYIDPNPQLKNNQQNREEDYVINYQEENNQGRNIT